jgi:hypothetical protein
MAKLAAVVDSLDTVPEPLRELYTEVEGKHVLDADIEGHPAVAGLKSALEKERKTAKDALAKARAAGDPAEVERLRTELEELRMQHPKPDVEKLVAKRLQEFEEKQRPILEERDRIKGELRTLRLDDRVKAAALKAGVFSEDVDDVLLIARRHFDLGEDNKVIVLDDDGDPAGKTPEQWFADVFKQRKPKFFKGADASGTGARGGGSVGEGVVVLSPEQGSDHQQYQAALKRVGGDHSKIKVTAAA